MGMNMRADIGVSRLVELAFTPVRRRADVTRSRKRRPQRQIRRFRDGDHETGRTLWEYDADKEIG
jgi:hypothetical protein